MKKILFLLLLSIAGYSQTETGQEQPFDYGIKNNASQTVTSPVFVVSESATGLYGKSSVNNLPLSTATINALKQKADLSTGLLKNGLVQINADPTKFNITAGTGIISNFTDPDNPVSTIITFPAFTGITPTYLLTGNITYIAINSTPAVVMQATPFTPEQRRDLIILGAAIHSNLTTINLVNNISAPTNAGTNQLHDLMEAMGAFNVYGNVYSANGANLSLNKSAGEMFKLGVNFANNWKHPHNLDLISGTLLSFRYRTQNGTEGSDVTVLNPAVYDLNNVLTAVPSNRFSIQTVTLFQTGVTRVQYGQSTYATLADAEASILTRAYVVEPNIAANGITRAYIILKNNATSLQTAADAKIVESQKFGGTVSGGVALTYASIVAALGYTPANDIDVVHKTGNETIAGVKTFTDYFTAANFKVTEANTRAIVGTSILANNTGTNLAGIGYGVFLQNTTGYDNSAVGTLALRNNTTGGGLVAIGNEALFTSSTGFYNSAVGDASLKFTTGAENTALGAYSGHFLTTGIGNVFLGNRAGRNQTTNSNRLIIDNQDRTTDILEQGNSLIYGQFNSDSSLQKLRFNARVGINQDVEDTFHLSILGAFKSSISIDAPRLNMINSLWGMQYFSNFGDRTDYTRLNSYVGFQWWKTNGNVELAYLDENGLFGTNSLKIVTTPTTSAGTYDILTRNTSTGVVEKVLSNTVATQSQIDLINSQINPNTYVVTDAGYSQLGQDITINTGWQWKINNISYTNAAPVVVNIPLATVGYTRIDLIVLNSSNTAVRIAGTETTGTPASPIVPLNTIQILFITTDSTTSTPVIPRPKNQVSQFLRNGETGYAPSEDVVFDALALKANLASPALTGTPTAPTATAGTNTTQIATTAFVFANTGSGILEYNNTDKTIWNKGKSTATEFNLSYGASTLTSASTTSYRNTGIGNLVLGAITTQFGNTAIGQESQSSASGNNNTSLGYQSLLQKSGNYNIAIGTQALSNLGSNSNTICIGASSSSLTTTGTNEIVIGDSATGNGSNTVTLGNTSIIKTVLRGVISHSTSYTVATLPTGTQGDTAYVTDATAPTYLGTLTGGGAVVCPVFYNGTAWVSH